MTDEKIQAATGRPLSEWFEVLAAGDRNQSPHKEIADYLHQECDVSYWWAQTITVEYERHIGRRVSGQTHDGSFQLGVSRTIDSSSGRVWEFLNSAEGIALLFGDVGSDPVHGHSWAAGLGLLSGTTRAGVTVTTTTYVDHSHLRLQWSEAGWESHSILQLRVTPRSNGKTTLSFHHEKLPTSDSRQRLRASWQEVAEKIVATLESAPE